MYANYRNGEGFFLLSMYVLTFILHSPLGLLHDEAYGKPFLFKLSMGDTKEPSHFKDIYESDSFFGLTIT